MQSDRAVYNERMISVGHIFFFLYIKANLSHSLTYSYFRSLSRKTAIPLSDI